ncbi:MAG: Eco57I restriction-modification methylase domain-containing protein [Clostridia bacterium]|nr:Eco57I restriction-modification methylase domain-containing protein [Clostridia bacterium]
MAEQSFFDRVSAHASHVPDVLSCIANLSNDEVFTPPEVVNRMLDLLPQELFADPKTTFLDPATKTGVFLREIAKRCLEAQLPGYKVRSAEISEKKSLSIPLDEYDLAFQKQLQERIDHIFHNQLYAIGITELTSLLARRSVYCSKYPNGPYSITHFDDSEGNIRFRRTEHIWKDGKCVFCGAAKSTYDRGKELETHAYELIHTRKPEEIFKMKFDVVIGNPPYQMTFGIEGGNSANAKSIYNLFIEQAIRLNPKYLCMITPSRWMTKTAQGIPEAWVDAALQSNKFKIIHDFENASECFPGVLIKGGVNYFLWDKDYTGKCSYYFHQAQDKKVLERYDYLDSKNAGIVVRDPQAYSILEKIEKVEGNYYLNMDNNFSGLVSAKHFFDNSELLTSNWTGYKSQKDNVHNIKYYVNVNRERTFRWISEKQLPKNAKTKNIHKVYIPAAGGSGYDDQILGKPFYGEANSVCSQTFLVIGYDTEKHNFTENECKNIITYIQTRFFRYLVSIKKKTQNGPRGVYQFVPLQDFTKPWTDEELYAKYELTDEEIAFIESMIKPMDLGGDSNG